MNLVTPSSFTRCFGIPGLLTKQVIAFNDTSRSRSYTRQRNVYEFPKLTPQEVSMVLRENECSHEFSDGPVKYFDSNQLASNSPIEDRKIEVGCSVTKSKLFGVFDGHGGHHCADFISKTLPYYISLSFLPLNVLADYLTSHSDENEILAYINKEYSNNEYVFNFYKENFRKYAYNLLASRTRDSELSVKNMFESAFNALDTDISQSALHGNEGKPNEAMLDVALTGSCACVAHIDGTHLQLANVGDCKAVLGSMTDDNKWRATSLTCDHNADNLDELRRVMNSHPSNEKNSIIRNERLLGQLIPLRACGDFMYKWSKDTVQKVIVPRIGAHYLPPNYLTPPYLISEPEVSMWKLTPRDKFMVIASDGLWEMMSPHQVVKYIGRYMSGKLTLDPVSLPRRNLKLKEINNLLAQRREGLSQKPVDTNAATHLIRTALGGTEYGIDHRRLSTMLTIPDEIVRSIRDDITIIVVFFRSDYFRNIKLQSEL